MRFKIFLISILLLTTSVIAEIYEISHEMILRYNFKSIYEIMEKIPVIYGTSYGMTGQNVSFFNNGQPHGYVMVYLDSLLQNKSSNSNYDFSDISVEKIEKIIINTNSVETSGLRIDLLTNRSSVGKNHESKVFYNDAYFNHRDLVFEVKQNFTHNSSFKIFAQVTDFMDNREYEDQFFTTPYEKQDYAAEVNLPSYWLIKPVISGGFSRKKLVDLSNDSMVIAEESSFLTIRGSLPINRTGFYNRLTANWQKNINNKIDFYNCDRYTATADFNWQIREFQLYSSSNLLYSDFYHQAVKGQIVENFGFDWEINSIFNFENQNHLSYTDNSDKSVGTSAMLLTKLPFGFSVAGKSAYYNESINGVGSFLSRSTEKLNSVLSLYFNYDNSVWKNNSALSLISVKDLLSSGDSPLYQASANMRNSWNKTLDFSVWYSVLLNKKDKPLQSDYSLSSEMNYRQQFYNDQLTINLNINHQYSRFFPGYTDNHPEYINNLNFKVSAKIIDCEIFFGINNLLKRDYSIQDYDYVINKHYNYQTIPGYDMPRKEEIWGVRWTFYN